MVRPCRVARADRAKVLPPHLASASRNKKRRHNRAPKHGLPVWSCRPRKIRFFSFPASTLSPSGLLPSSPSLKSTPRRLSLWSLSLSLCPCRVCVPHSLSPSSIPSSSRCVVSVSLRLVWALSICCSVSQCSISSQLLSFLVVVAGLLCCSLLSVSATRLLCSALLGSLHLLLNEPVPKSLIFHSSWLLIPPRLHLQVGYLVCYFASSFNLEQ